MQLTLHIENQFVRVLCHIDFSFPHQTNGCQPTILGVSPFKQLLRRSSTLSELSCMGMFEALEGRPGAPCLSAAFADRMGLSVVSPHPSRVSGGSVPRILVPPLARLRSSKGTEPRAYAHG